MLQEPSGSLYLNVGALACESRGRAAACRDAAWARRKLTIFPKLHALRHQNSTMSRLNTPCEQG